ncbi:hypothetical protein B0H12DRAFT_1134211 [Mycena haematopus]|nr:hypothetical protein B0H12DRAFT_1134211 [Mycena haematopus]
MLCSISGVSQSQPLLSRQLHVHMDSQSLPTSTMASQRRHVQHDINFDARQLLPSPLTSSSSYDYWWPYPPVVLQQQQAHHISPDPSTDTLLASPTDTTPALVFSFESDSAVISSSDSLDVTSLSLSIASSSASESIISISALPPSNTTIPSNSHAKLSMISASNLVYIVPICGVVGLLVGGITAWWWRKSYGMLEVGPEYMPPSPRLSEKQESEEGEWVGGEKYAEECDAEDTRNEKEGFLHPGSAQVRPAHYTIRTKTDVSATTVSTAARTKSYRSSRAPSPTPSGRTSLFFDRPDSTDTVPWESLRHKSIKRGILERLWDDGQKDSKDRMARRPWQAHGRNDSDLLYWPGFRILPESPGETPQRERGADVFRWPSVQEDKYTRVPVRVARSRSRSPEKASRAASPEKFERRTSPNKLARAASPPVRREERGRPTDIKKFAADRESVPTTDFRSVLPQSPPRISSPLLDGALCFTPILEATPEMTSFASFGAPAAEGVGHGAGERTFRGADHRGRQ